MIARKPKAKGKPSPKEVERLIRKGGASAKPEASGSTAVLLKIPAATLEAVDELVARRKVRTYRSTWLMEAIVEKVEREQ